MESPDPKDLVEQLLINKKDPLFIIDLLAGMIKQQMMYGGSLSDKVAYELDKAKKESFRS